VNRVQTEALVAYLQSNDPNVRTRSDEALQFRVSAWAKLLEAVPFEFAMEYINHELVDPTRRREVNLADVRTAWRIEQDRVEQAARRERLDEPQVLGDALAHLVIPDWFKAYAAESHEVAVELRAKGYAPGDPEWEEAYPPLPDVAVERAAAVEPDTIERRCRFWRSCACTHTICYDGWLDEEEYTTRIVQNRPRKYVAVRRCPICAEAIDMHETLAAEQQPRRRWR
jgi:hypothetical protein